MIISVLILSVSAFLLYRLIKLGSFILIMMGLVPFQQSVYVYYGYYFLDDFLANNFIHFRLLQEGDIDFILLNFAVYIAGILFFGLLFYYFFPRQKTALRKIDTDIMLFSIDKLILVYSVIALIFLVSTDLNNFFAKVMRLGFYHISFVPLLIGYFIQDFKRRTLFVFLAVALFFVVLNLLVGSRGYMAVMFFTFTYGMLANQKNRVLFRYYLLAVALLMIVVVPFLGFIELFRSEFGRLEYEDVDQERIELLTREYQNNEKYEKSSESSFARNIIWPNLSVMIMTDREVPSVGFDNLKNDLAFIFTNTFISGKTLEESREQYLERLWGTGPANLYGYSVNLSNSVEFSALADGIWRYGKFGFLVNLFFLVLIGLLAEGILLNKITRKGVDLFTVFWVGNMYLVFIATINIEPLISVIRTVVYMIFFCYLFTFVMSPFVIKRATVQ
ncbi:MAG: hypothetical protein IM575_02655 [Cytophagales bacterium]|nr:hypothetical protein [Cytophagales bacterium]